jgi:hypothetical protein
MYIYIHIMFVGGLWRLTWRREICWDRDSWMIRRSLDQPRETSGFNHKKWSSGWWLTYPFEKYDFVSWDDDSIPNCFWKVIKFHGSSHHQPVNHNRGSNVQTLQVVSWIHGTRLLFWMFIHPSSSHGRLPNWPRKPAHFHTRFNDFPIQFLNIHIYSSYMYMAGFFGPKVHPRKLLVCISTKIR